MSLLNLAPEIDSNILQWTTLRIVNRLLSVWTSDTVVWPPPHLRPSVQPLQLRTVSLYCANSHPDFHHDDFLLHLSDKVKAKHTFRLGYLTGNTGFASSLNIHSGRPRENITPGLFQSDCYTLVSWVLSFPVWGIRKEARKSVIGLGLGVAMESFEVIKKTSEPERNSWASGKPKHTQEFVGVSRSNEDIPPQTFTHPATKSSVYWNPCWIKHCL